MKISFYFPNDEGQAPVDILEADCAPRIGELVRDVTRAGSWVVTHVDWVKGMTVQHYSQGSPGGERTEQTPTLSCHVVLRRAET